MRYKGLIIRYLFSFFCFKTHSRYDLLVWFELLELDVSGEYKPVPVEHGPERNRGMFLLHHGVQRKIGVTITHESSPHLRWIEVCEVVIGRVRSREEGQVNQVYTLVHGNKVKPISTEIRPSLLTRQ